jgi:hypothetical protein
MKVLAIVSTAALSLLLGGAAPAYAQHEQHAQQQGHAQQQQHAQSSKPVQHRQHAQQARPSAQHPQHAQQPRPSAQHTQHAQQARASRPARQQQAQRGEGDRGRRIPDDRFRANFGREHSFHINRPTMVAGYPRFQYGGYWFGFYDPWPVGWYYTDDVYVDYIGGGYYLYNPVHPGIRISISVL